MCTVPPLGEAPNTSHFSDVIAEINNLEQYISGKQPGSPAPMALLSKKQKIVNKLDKHISFDTSIRGHGVDISAASSGSVVTIGGALEPNFNVNASASDNLNNNNPLSA